MKPIENRLSESHGALFRAEWQTDFAWPERYGVVGDDVPNGCPKQLALPFVWNG
jgi:hypothetical protein